ncbi:protein ABHD12B isoform X2 [Oryzias latipes]|uniref:AB hydrolase-1 domain-containing protein n=1 Tax=Oryzias latipes TaxID=8090 RepID=A0A3B3I393_ORYLA|nr:protein ABHD12B isoform X2 [Oryzias latipes]
MRRTLTLLISVYASVPVFLYLFPWLLSHAVFAHLLRVPFFVDLSRPQDVLNHTCNFYLNTEEDVWVGVWHTLPASQWEAASGRSADWYQEALGDGQPVIIYLHGNVGTRALRHRVELVTLLSAAGFHVLSLDYRGFGDSSGHPSEAGLTSDALYLQQWAKTRSGGSPVCLWGHSLGSGVATNAAVRLQEGEAAVDALILEAPYTRIGDVAANLLLTKIYTFLPGLKDFLFDLLEKNQIEFANDKNLKTLTCPLLILHAEDDNVVPHRMGQQLYQVSLEAQREFGTDDRVAMVSYPADLGFSHSNIYMDPSLPEIVKKFLQNSRR